MRLRRDWPSGHRRLRRVLLGSLPLVAHIRICWFRMLPHKDLGYVLMHVVRVVAVSCSALFGVR
jgi:hypothetical protein